MGDQDRGRHASRFQKLFRNLFIEEIKAECPYGHRYQEREELAGAKRILRIVHDDIQGRDNRQQSYCQDADPIQQDDSVCCQEAHFKERRERDNEHCEIPLPYTPPQQKPIHGRHPKQGGNKSTGCQRTEVIHPQPEQRQKPKQVNPEQTADADQ